MSKEVYVVVVSEDYGGDGIEGVFSTYEKAEECLEKLAKEGNYKKEYSFYRSGAYTLEIRDFTLDEHRPW